uniref:Uncharacterized protein n=1 Tax=Romanomermis culicivorax TaxID=13658 RepID=A0A915J414_ROMCU
MLNCCAKDKTICFGSLCEDTLYNIKMHTNVDSDISTRGIKNQCPKSKNFLLKFVQPYDVRWFDVGIAVNIYNPDCKSFMILCFPPIFVVFVKERKRPAGDKWREQRVPSAAVLL